MSTGYWQRRNDANAPGIGCLPSLIVALLGVAVFLLAIYGTWKLISLPFR